MKSRSILALVILGLFGSSALAAAPVRLTRNMTCEQTREYSEGNGRVYVVANGKDVIPLYGYVDRCGYSEIQSPVYVKTLDNSHCLIGFRCYAD